MLQHSKTLRLEFHVKPSYNVQRAVLFPGKKNLREYCFFWVLLLSSNAQGYGFALVSCVRSYWPIFSRSQTWITEQRNVSQIAINVHT